MYKFADKSVDISNDYGYKSLSDILSSGVKDLKGKDIKLTREAFKDLDVFEPGDLDYLGDDDFALIYHDKEGNTIRRFPMPTYDDAIVSTLYFLKNADKLPVKAQTIAAKNLSDYLYYNHKDLKVNFCNDTMLSITQALDQYAHMLGFHDGKTNIYNERDEGALTFNQKVRRGIFQEKEARAKFKDSDFVFVSSKGRLFPIYDKESLKKQAAYFDTYANQFTLNQRHTFAKKLRDKAASLGVSLKADTISKYASHRWSPTAYDCVAYRIKMLGAVKPVFNEKTASLELHTLNSKEADKAIIGFKKLANLVGRINIDTFAETLYHLDKVAGLDKAYGKTLTNAFSSVYFPTKKVGRIETMKKIASGLAGNLGKIYYAGKNFDVNKLFNLDIGDLGGMIDEDTFEELKSDPVNVFNSLPLPYKSVIADALGRI